MDTKIRAFVCFVVMFVVLSLTGCGSIEPEATPTPTRTPAASTPTTVPPTAIPPTATPAPTATPDPYPGWASYESSDYGFAFRYPVTWGLIEIPAGAEAPMGPAAHTVRLMREGVRLGIQVKRQTETYVMGPSGRGAGELVERGPVAILGSTLPKKVQVYEGKDKSLWLGGQIDELEVYAQLDIEYTPGIDYDSAELSTEVQAEVDAILGSFVRTIVPPQPSADAAASDAPVLGDTRARAADGMTMVYVPAGEFLMGSDDDDGAYALELCEQYESVMDCASFVQYGTQESEQPVHPVELSAFWIDRTEVTYAQYQKCVDAGVCQELVPFMWFDGESIPILPDYPVVYVFDSQAPVYCEWAGGRLPTEAEWEYAARGPENLRFPWGNTFDPTRLNYADMRLDEIWPKDPMFMDSHADTTFDDGYAYMAPVGSYPTGASWCGALDMAGNAEEIVADWNGVYTVERQVNPTGPAGNTSAVGEFKIARGGSYQSPPVFVRSAGRSPFRIEGASQTHGFRCVMPGE